MHFKAVLFDMDGTLVNSVDDVADSMNLVLASNNLLIHPTSEYIQWIGDGMENLVISALPANYRDDSFVKKCVAEMKTNYDKMWMNKTHLYAGIAELLSALREFKIKLAVLSNKPHRFTQIIADKLLAEWNFDVVMGLNEGIPRKPDPTSALEIANQMNLNPKHFLYVGDTATDIQTAINAGMYPVGVSWGYRSTNSLIESGAKEIIYTPNELLSLL
jgi:phosphoglycolate phosphatase